MSEATVQTGTLETNVPARLDRLPWSRFHWLVVVGLGTVWILDGLEVTIVGSIGGRLTESGSGINISASQIGSAGAIYVIGACLGALFFGQLTDRFGRKKLFMITLAVYIAATAATAFSFAPWYFFLVRFFTGAGIGGEYAAINSAIDELIPARARGRVDLTINGSYWIGSVIASALAIIFLDKSIFPADLGWRLEFGVGVVLAFGILIVRRHVPESPRWLFIHGREEEAEAIVSGIESDVEEETGHELETPDKTITVRQRTSIPFREIARVAFKAYPKRAILGLALFVGQAFIYNGITFNLGTLFTTFYGVSSSFVPVFIIIFGVGNFLGPLLLGRLFDTVGRKPMITAMYLGSALLTVPMALLFTGNTVGKWEFEAFVFVVFFLASAGASAAYLTVSEIFPMETRALAIAFFYAVGTGVGGAIGPLLFGNLINSGVRSQVEIAFFIGAAVMAIGGIAEILFGVRAERAQLEDIAAPLTADEAEEQGEPEEGEGEADGREAGVSEELLAPERRESLVWRQRAEEARAAAAEHRARAHEVRFESERGNGQPEDRVGIEEALSEIAELQAKALDERAFAEEVRAGAADCADEHARDGALERADAAEQRAIAQDERAAALGAEDRAEAERHEALAATASERARAHEHRSQAHRARGRAAQSPDGKDEDSTAGGADAEDTDPDVAQARADMHDAWAMMHESQAAAHMARATSEDAEAQAADGEIERLEQAALAAEERVRAAEHRAQVRELDDMRRKADVAVKEREENEERERRRRETEERIRARLSRRQQREQHGLRRFRPGPASAYHSPGMLGTVPTPREASEEALDHELDTIGRALDEHGATDREDLARLVGARYWGPGRFGPALREAVSEGRARRLSLRTYGPPRESGESGNGEDSGS